MAKLRLLGTLGLGNVKEAKMAQERLTMRKTAEVLRLKWACGLSDRAIARSCSILFYDYFEWCDIGQYVQGTQEYTNCVRALNWRKAFEVHPVDWTLFGPR